MGVLQLGGPPVEKLTDTENQLSGGHGKGSEGLEVLNAGKVEKESG